MAIDTFKITERKKVILDLKKQKGIAGQKARVVLVVDYSLSMRPLYSNGTVQDTVERILPLGLGFDDDGQVEAYLFHDGFVKLEKDITLKNLDGYVNNEIVRKHAMGYTNYAPVIKDIVKKFGNERGAFGFGSLNAAKIPTYVIFITDGECGDQSDSEKAIKEASSNAIFFQFVGIGRESFDFLQKLDDLKGRKVDNADFFKIEDLTKVTDANLYDQLMNEFPGFIKEAQAAALLV